MTRRWLNSITAALGLTSIACVWIVGPLISPNHTAIYHWSAAASSLFLPTIIDFLCVWLLLVPVMYAAQGLQRVSVLLWAATTSLLPWIALLSLSLLLNLHPARWTSRLILGLCVVSFVILRTHRWNDWKRVRELTLKIYCVCSVYGVLVLVQLGWFGWQACKPSVSELPHRTAQPTLGKGKHPRIVWILLDELSYQQVYGHRFHNLSLPAFDQLASQSTVFTDVIPAGYLTEVVMPSLISGTPVDQARFSSTGNAVALHNPFMKRWKKFDEHDTIFEDALNTGYKTAVAGWHNPYCRILPDVLDRCFWTFGFPVGNTMNPRASLTHNVLSPALVYNPLLLSSRLARLLPQALNLSDPSAPIHIADYEQISHAADDLLEDRSLDFILVHMPIPHPGGIFNRAEHRFATRNSTYIDNLALADAYLAHVRSLLESADEWDSSAIIIMGDHSWRTQPMWASFPSWTSEENEASDGGRFDNRPAYMVKLPLQKGGSIINKPFPAVDTRLLLRAILEKKIVSARDLSLWVEELERR